MRCENVSEESNNSGRIYKQESADNRIGEIVSLEILDNKEKVLFLLMTGKQICYCAK